MRSNAPGEVEGGSAESGWSDRGGFGDGRNWNVGVKADAADIPSIEKPLIVLNEIRGELLQIPAPVKYRFQDLKATRKRVIASSISIQHHTCLRVLKRKSNGIWI